MLGKKLGHKTKVFLNEVYFFPIPSIAIIKNTLWESGVAATFIIIWLKHPHCCDI